MISRYMRMFSGMSLTVLVPIIYLIFLLFGNRWNFLGDAYLTIETLPNLFLFVLPLVSGIAAFDTSTVVRRGFVEMVAVTPRARFASILPAFVVAGTAGGLHAIFSFGLIAVSDIWEPRVGWGMMLWVLGVQLGAFLLVSLIGALLAVLTGARLAPFLAFATTFLYIAAAELFPGGVPLIPASGASTRQLWYTWNTDYKLLQTILALFACIVLVAVFNHLRKNTAVRTKPSNVAILAAGLIISTGFLLPSTPYKVEIIPRPEKDICIDMESNQGAALSLCTFPEESRTAGYLQNMVILGYSNLESSGYLPSNFPTRFESYGFDALDNPDPHTLYITVPHSVSRNFNIPAPSDQLDYEMIPVLANVLSLPSMCLQSDKQDELFFASPSTMEETFFDILETANILLEGQGTPRLEAEEFQAAYHELTQWCGE